jgi:hypothetical protein
MLCTAGRSGQYTGCSTRTAAAATAGQSAFEEQLLMLRYGQVPLQQTSNSSRSGSRVAAVYA